MATTKRIPPVTSIESQVYIDGGWPALDAYRREQQRPTEADARAALAVLDRFFQGDVSQGLLAELEAILDEGDDDTDGAR
jgi:hypothetical protein